ncbi:Homeobox-leucine zipper protein family [Quillaja saponaria]|uniref:Homeobox-leucine zipper protein family n=1 Tax=Quillaja saponaria TaxID=32244 RepID=A0AAD7PHK1_QUISA|nr:Homeobox-leucine zipper protein family [Quillaja saponaria]
MEEDEACNTSLCLGLGIGGYVPIIGKEKKKIKENKAPPLLCLDQSFERCPPKKEALKVDHHDHDHDKAADGFRLKRINENNHYDHYPEIDGKSDNSINSNNKKGCRKKLRLTKQQSALLEDSFKLHTTLNPVQKQALAEKLNVKSRQVEVWFQNRRARTKLKQTEVDCEFLKKCCESLSEENRRLKKELQELRGGIRVGPHSQLQNKAATLTICSSCEKKLVIVKNNNQVAAAAEVAATHAAFLDVVRIANNKLQSGLDGTKIDHP